MVLFYSSLRGKDNYPRKQKIVAETDIIFPGCIKWEIFYKIGFTITKKQFSMEFFYSKSTDFLRISKNN